MKKKKRISKFLMVTILAFAMLFSSVMCISSQKMQMVYAEETYTVTYDLNGGSGTTPVDENQYAMFGEVSIANCTATNGNYTFLCWNTEADGSGTGYNAGSTLYIDGNVTLYAIWYDESSSYSITFNLNGGECALLGGNVPGRSALAENQTIDLTDECGDITKTGYACIGWSTDKNATTASKSYTVNANDAVNKVITLYAIWKKAYVINYDGVSWTGDTDANFQKGDALTIEYSSDITIYKNGMPANYTAFFDTKTEDYSFANSYCLVTTSGYEIYIVDSQICILYDKNGGNSYYKIQDSKTYDVGDSVTLAQPTDLVKSGYTFLGWALTSDATTALSSYTVARGDVKKINNPSLISIEDVYGVTFYAVWAEPCTVTYDDNVDGEEITVPDEASYDSGTEVTVGSAPTRIGYRFVCWNTQKDDTGNSYEPGSTFVVEGNTTLYAVWEKIIKTEPNKDNDYTVTINDNFSDETYQWQKAEYDWVDATQTHLYYCNIGNNAMYPSTNAVSAVSNCYFQVDSDITSLRFKFSGTGTVEGCTYLDGYYYPTYDSVNKYFTAQVSNKGGDDQFTDIEAYAANYSDIKDETSAQLSTSSENTSYRCVVTVGTDTAISETVSTKSISFDGNGSTSGTAPTTLYQLEGRTIELPSGGFSKTGYKFLGWNTDKEASTALDSYKVGTSDATLYAIWEKLYTVSYNANAGEDTVTNMPTDTKQYEECDTVTVDTTTIPVRDGYKFVGWNTESSATHAEKFTKNQFDIENDTILYAIWAEKNHYTYDDGWNVAPEASYNAGDTIVISSKSIQSAFFNINGKVFYHAMGIAGVWSKEYTIKNDGTTLVLEEEISGIASLTDGYKVTYDDNVVDEEITVPTDDNYYGTETFEYNSVTYIYEKGTISTTLPTRAGYVLTGWNTNAEGTGVMFNPGDTFALESDLTFYAIWKEYSLTQITGVIDTIAYDNDWTFDQAKFIAENNISTLFPDKTKTDNVSYILYEADKAVKITSDGTTLTFTSVDNRNEWSDKIGSSNFKVYTLGNLSTLDYVKNELSKYTIIEAFADIEEPSQAANIISVEGISLDYGDIIVYGVDEENNDKYTVYYLAKVKTQKIYDYLELTSCLTPGVKDYESFINAVIQVADDSCPTTEKSQFFVLNEAIDRNIIETKLITEDKVGDDYKVHFSDADNYKYFYYVVDKNVDINSYVQTLTGSKIKTVAVDKDTINQEGEAKSIESGDTLAVVPNSVIVIYRCPLDLEKTNTYLVDAIEVVEVPEPTVQMVIAGNTTYYSTIEYAFAGIEDGQTVTITLLDDQTVTNTIDINNSKKITINLNKNDICFELDTTCFHIDGATLTITGEGTVYGGENANNVVVLNGSSDSEASEYSVFNLDADACLDHIKSGISIDKTKTNVYGYGVQVNIHGDITGDLEYPAILVNSSITGTGDNIAQVNIDGATIQGQADLTGKAKVKFYNSPSVTAMYKSIVVKNADVTIESGSYHADIPDGEDETPIALQISKNAEGTLNVSGGSFYGVTTSKTETINSFVTGGKFIDLGSEYVANTHGRKTIDEAGLCYEVVARVAADKVAFKNAPENWQSDIYNLMDKYELVENAKGKIKGELVNADNGNYDSDGAVYLHIAPDELYYFDANTKVEGLNGDGISVSLVDSSNLTTIVNMGFEDAKLGDLYVVDRKLYRENAKDIEGISIDKDLKVNFADDTGYYFIEAKNTDQQAKDLYELYTTHPVYSYSIMNLDEQGLKDMAAKDGASLKAYAGKTIIISHADTYYYETQEECWYAMIDKALLVKVPELDKINDKEVSGGAKGEFYVNGASDLPAHITGINLADIKGTNDDGESTDNYSNIVVWYDKNNNGVFEQNEELTYSDDYTVSQGSVVVTLTESFLNTLKVGEHSIIVDVTDKSEIKHEFEIPVTIKARASSSSSYKVVKTGVEATYNPPLRLVPLLSLVTIFGVIILKNRKH